MGSSCQCATICGVGTLRVCWFAGLWPAVWLPIGSRSTAVSLCGGMLFEMPAQHTTTKTFRYSSSLMALTGLDMLLRPPAVSRFAVLIPGRIPAILCPRSKTLQIFHDFIVHVGGLGWSWTRDGFGVMARSLPPPLRLVLFQVIGFIGHPRCSRALPASVVYLALQETPSPHVLRTTAQGGEHLCLSAFHSMDYTAGSCCCCLIPSVVTTRFSNSPRRAHLLLRRTTSCATTVKERRVTEDLVWTISVRGTYVVASSVAPVGSGHQRCLESGKSKRVLSSAISACRLDRLAQI